MITGVTLVSLYPKNLEKLEETTFTESAATILTMITLKQTNNMTVASKHTEAE